MRMYLAAITKLARSEKVRTGIGARTLLAAAAALLIAVPVPAKAAGSVSGKPDTTARIDAYMEAAMKRLHIPGAALGIVKKDGDTFYLQGYGTSDPSGAKTTPQTAFVLGSTSKSITAAAVMQLAEQGKINLEAPVRRYLPDFRTADPERSDRIRVKDLLYQTSGFSKYDGVAALTQGDSTIGAHIGGLHKISLVRDPGTGFEYSNLNYNVLGGLVEKVSGTSYTAYVKDYLFEPLEMKNSFGSPQEAEGADMAAGYQSVFGFKVPTRQLAHSGTVPSGYLISTAEDMTHYLSAQMNGGRYKGKSVWSEKSGAALHKPEASMGGGASYAMGWTVKNGVLFHDGATENTYSFMVIHGDTGIILLLNTMDYLVPYDQIVMGIYGILEGEDAPVESLPNYIRTYALADMALAAVLALAVRSFYSLFRRKKRVKPTAVRIAFSAAGIAGVHLLLPACILMLPKLLHAPWPVLMVFLPGLSQGLYFMAILLVCTGLLKIAAVVRAIRVRKTAL
ncbi:serine hydrolase [Paenibacillus sp. GbtcB18]|uniref:serine hydrolase domain-containing protein n=1 Tax=Paenibacillus sp. GbtcB18 TaxID=2824763 RepID=UPI0020C651F1|nr:serine hydrolase domain-containing protein [Paenibacillus sp. GbtcB18]